MIATDVAARGLDITGVDRIINYDFPHKVLDYIHRIGRTGRGGAAGAADTLFTPQDARHATDLVRVLKEVRHVTPRHATNCLPLTAHHPLFTACCSLRTTYH